MGVTAAGKGGSVSAWRLGVTERFFCFARRYADTFRIGGWRRKAGQGGKPRFGRNLTLLGLRP
jgi:hypothetical protein